MGANMTNISIFKSKTGETEVLKAYDELIKLWGVPYEERKILTTFGETHVMVCGPKDGKPVVMLHGMTGNSSFWYATIPSLKSFRIFCIDTVGDFGKSKVKIPLKTEEDCVSWMDQVFEQLSLQRFSLIGHSMGGWLSLNYARHRSEKVRELILLAPIASFKSVPFLKLAWYIYPAMLFPSFKRIQKGWQWFCAKGYQIHPAVLNQAIASYTHCRMLLSAMPKNYAKEDLEMVKMPVLFLVGEEEKIYKPTKVVAAVKEKLPQAVTKIIPQSGHLLIAEQPDKVNNEIRHFLSGRDKLS